MPLPRMTAQSFTPSFPASFFPSPRSSNDMDCMTPFFCSQKTQTSLYPERSRFAAASFLSSIALNLHASTHAPQSVHLPMSITAFLLAMWMASNGHAFTQSVQPVHFSRNIIMEAGILMYHYIFQQLCQFFGNVNGVAF